MPASLPTPLDPLRFPLRGSRLIEASAGTGKTFTIAALYLRLVLHHGGDAAFTRALVPPEILVVTFTEAATKELRERIRARLAEAAEAFDADPSNEPPHAPGADLLHDLRADYAPAQWPGCARALRLAAEWMDESAVSTIHGWCNRMLREHAFDSGSLFTQSLETDQRALQAEVQRDYWRTFFLALPQEQAALVRGWWRTPEDLGRALQGLLPIADTLQPGAAPADALAQAAAEAATQLARCKAPFGGDAGWAAALLAGLEAAVAAKQCKMPKRRDWMQALRDWAEGDALWPALTDTAWKRLSPTGMAEGWSGDGAFLAHPAWEALGCLRQALAQLPDGRVDILCHATHWSVARMAAEQAQRAQMGFQELLTRLDAALQGPNGARLAALVRTQFPVALIDEFQDTDPLQYRIFDAIYGVARNAQDTALLLIGDPKQAIYAFRGADIHTYLAAREDTAGRHATLGTNFRSTQAMVAAVNALFERAEQRPEGEGAFLFRGADGDNRLPFIPVQARGSTTRWEMEGEGDGEGAPALRFWHAGHGDTVARGAARQAFAAGCAGEIVRLLRQGQAGTAGFRGGDGVLQPVQPGDIAVLVSSGTEADAVREALSQRGVRSVYLSDKASVFSGGIAGELQRLLAACAEPEDDRLLRAALASALLALDWAALDALNHDALGWEQRVLQFRRYQQMWRRQGVLPMLRHLLQDFGVPQRLLVAGDERALTDLLHLAELLQQASTLIAGEHALIRWLAEARADEVAGGGDAEARKQRLESDAALVKVVTVHKSKGLEYPLVFLPFATAFRATKPDDLPLLWHDDAGRPQAALHPDADAAARVDRERLAEDLRKLYVALTRARFATWVGAAALEQVERSALGYLLAGGQPLSPDGLVQALHDLARDGAAVAVDRLPEAGAARYVPDAATPALRAPPPLPTGPREPWWIASYSALRLRQDASDALVAEAGLVDGPAMPSAAGPATALEDVHGERLDEEDPDAADAQPADGEATQAGSLHAFPRGARPGTFLHGLLEWVARQGFARLRDEPAVQADLADFVARRCNLSGWSRWTQPLQAWLLEWVRTPWHLPSPGGVAEAPPPVAPDGLGSPRAEMEFWFSAQQVDTTTLDALVCRHTLGGAPRAPLQPQQVNGMLKGYIDLVFTHAGRYYVADYKSNWLGPADADYGPATLRRAVLQHRYELQYVLYVFALHRLLRQRLPGYDYDRHVGGAVYLFLRGHAAPGQGLHIDRPPRVLIEALDALFRGEALPAAAGATA